MAFCQINIPSAALLINGKASSHTKHRVKFTDQLAGIGRLSSLWLDSY
ncbi:hypothetical protein [Allocoleopsis franciscana]|nr:hypothetical protein [Allocoleopsis franciscana]